MRRIFRFRGTKASVGPEVDQRVDVRMKRVRRQLEDLVIEHVRMQRAEEQSRGCTVIGDAHRARRRGAGEVTLHDSKSLTWRRILGLAVERDSNLGRRCPLMHVDGDDDGHDAAEERNELSREVAEHDARIGVAGGRVEVTDALRQLDLSAPHRVREEPLLRPGVTKNGGGGDLQLAGDVRERCGVESLSGENASRRVEQLLPLNRRRPAHL
jgi:hypothetical protein